MSRHGREWSKVVDSQAARNDWKYYEGWLKWKFDHI